MFLTSKSFVLLWLFMGRKMRKKYFQKHGKNISFCVSSKSSLFEVAILNLGLEGSNLKILRLGRAHMPRNIQNDWFLTKNNHVKKSVPKICNSPRALALKRAYSDPSIIGGWFSRYLLFSFFHPSYPIYLQYITIDSQKPTKTILLIDF